MRIGKSATSCDIIESLRAFNEAKFDRFCRALRDGLSSCLCQTLFAVANRDKIPHGKFAAHRFVFAKIMHQWRNSQSDAGVFEQSHTRRPEFIRVRERRATCEGSQIEGQFFLENQRYSAVVSANINIFFWINKQTNYCSVILIIIGSIVFCAWNRDERINEAEDPIEAAQCNNFWDKILKSFSLQNNWKSLMDDTTTANSISVINGIKYEFIFLNKFNDRNFKIIILHDKFKIE